jgi:Tol biopolymer transport system component
MTLSPGVRLGPYEILSPLGAGGMGEVYRALDPRLRREVALKILPATVAGDAERLKRFEREARALAGLSHPNLVVVHDVGVGDPPYIVMELVSGETLRERLRGGPLVPARAARIAAQIARALAAAHSRGVVHRDLKPENVVLDRQDNAKVLDFGLARLAAGSALTPEAQAAPTLSEATVEGAVMGTPGYMAPEQVRGEPAEATADIFALGAILYEMLTGERAFSGASTVETLHAILRRDPPGDSLPGGAAPLAPIVRRCLEKAPEARFQSAADLAWELERPAIAPGAPQPRDRRRFLAALVLAGLGGAIGTALWLRLAARAPAAAPAAAPARWADARLTPVTTDPGYEGDPSLSPDGQTIAYAADRGGNLDIYLQQLEGGPPIKLTDDPEEDTQPAFSPDGRQIAFVSGRGTPHGLRVQNPGAPLTGGGIWTMPALGGPARRIVDGAFPSWTPDGASLVFVRGIWFKNFITRVPAAGGEPVEIPVELPEGTVTPPWYYWPSVSPDGRFLAFEGAERIYVVPFAGGKARRVAWGRRPAWTHDGKGLLFTSYEPGRAFGLCRVDPFSSAESPPVEALTFGPGLSTSPSASTNGQRIVFAAQRSEQNLLAVPFDADGAGVLGPPAEITTGGNDVRFFSPSPDGSEVAAEMERGGEVHIWRLAAGRLPFQLTSEKGKRDGYPRWSPDGATIAFVHEGDLWTMSSDGGNPRRVSPIDRPTPSAGTSGLTKDQRWVGWTPAGRFEWAPKSDAMILVTHEGDFRKISLRGEAETMLSHGLHSMSFFDVTRDLRFLAYQSNEGASVDIRVLSIAEQSIRKIDKPVTEDYHPFFSPGARWLYFQSDHKNVYRVPGPAQSPRDTPPEQVTRFPEAGLYLEQPQISRDGKTLFFTRGKTVADLWLLELDGRGESAASK